MTTSHDTEVPSSGSLRPAQRRYVLIGVLVGVAVLLAAVGLGYRFGEHAPGPQWHTGTGYATTDGASVEAGGWTYWVPAHIPWQGADGAHDGDRPSCLPTSGPVEKLRFVAVPVTVDGSSWRAVVFVSCAGQ
jgi:hypothetical protein